MSGAARLRPRGVGRAGAGRLLRSLVDAARAARRKAPEPAPPRAAAPTRSAPRSSRGAAPPRTTSRCGPRDLRRQQRRHHALRARGGRGLLRLRERKQAPRRPRSARRFAKALSGIIENRLQLQQAEREKIVVEDAEMKEQLDEIKKRLGAKRREEFEQMVKAQGLNVEGVKKRLREQILVERIKRRKVTPPHLGDRAGDRPVPQRQPREARDGPDVRGAAHPLPADRGSRGGRLAGGAAAGRGRLHAGHGRGGLRRARAGVLRGYGAPARTAAGSGSSSAES